MSRQNGRPTTWTKEQVEQLIKMRAEDASIPDIAATVGKTIGAVSVKISLLKAQGRTKEDGQSGTPVPTRELNPLEKERATRIALGVVEKFALGERVS